MKRFIVSCLLTLVILATICGGSMQNSVVAMAENGLELNSKSAALIDYASGQILFEKNATEHLPVASMVKMMTILLTLEEIDSGHLTLDTMVTTSENASGMGGSQVFIDPYVEYSAEDLLKSVIMASANDASVALAEHISGSEQAFVEKMNERAHELQMNNTNYVNCTGLPAPEQYSCALDSAIVLKAVSSHDIYHNYSTIWMDELTHPSGRKTELVNTNRLVRYYDGCDGGKTGSTNEAGCCLTATAKRGNMRLISVIVGAPNSQTRFNECSKLFSHGFANYENRTLLDCAKPCASARVNKGKAESVDIYASECYSVVTRKGDKGEFEVNLDAPKEVKAPTKSGDKVGIATITKDGVVLKEISLILKDDVAKLSLKDCFDKVVEEW